MVKRIRVREEVRRKVERAIGDLLHQEQVSSEERFKGVILLMRAHGLPTDPERIVQIRKYWDACVDDLKRRRKRN